MNLSLKRTEQNIKPQANEKHNSQHRCLDNSLDMVKPGRGKDNIIIWLFVVGTALIAVIVNYIRLIKQTDIIIEEMVK